jgi:DNA excision repair protein ERCC-4
VSDLRKTADLLWVRFIILFPRFEDHVQESILPCDAEIIQISLRGPRKDQPESEFAPIVGKVFSRVFEILSALHSAFIHEYGRHLRITEEESLALPKRSLENRAQTEEQTKVLESLMFLRHSFRLLLHEDPVVFAEFIASHRSSQLYQPHWATFPQASTLFALAPSLAEEGIPSPKLQWIVHLLANLPHNKRILILAEGAGTVGMICGFLAGFAPKTDSTDLELPIAPIGDDDELLIDPEVFGVMEPPMILLQEFHGQADVYERFQPDFVIMWDVTLLALRRLEVFNSRYRKSVVAYLLSFTEAKELTTMTNAGKHENEVFVSCIQELSQLSLLPLQTFSSGNRQIIVDDREFRSSLPLALLQVGFKVIPAVIAVGDYVLTEDIVIERKAYSDLVGSLKSGRLLQQLQRMRTFYKQSMLLIEFSETDQFNSVSARDKSSMVMAKLVTIMRHFPTLRIIWARNNAEAAKTLWALADGQSEPDLARAVGMGSVDRESLKERSRADRFLMVIPFLTSAHIDAITSRFRSVKALAQTSREELMTVIEPAIAIKLYSLLHAVPRPTSS